MMPEDDDELREPSRGTVLGHFINCWRGESEIGDAFLASVIIFSAVNIPLGLLRQHASSAGWSQTQQSAIVVLGLIGSAFVVTWFTVSMWRAARRKFLLGQRFWPIVASLAAALVAGGYVTAFVVGFIDGNMRVR
jgi:hypothetical protein